MTQYSQQLTQKLALFLKDEKGMTAVEYGVLAALLGLGIVGGSSILGVEYKRLWSCMNASFRSLDHAC